MCPRYQDQASSCISGDQMDAMPGPVVAGVKGARRKSVWQPAPPASPRDPPPLAAFCLFHLWAPEKVTLSWYGRSIL